MGRTSRVILTIHERDLAEWQQRLTDRITSGSDRSLEGSVAVGVTRELMQLIADNSIGYRSILTGEESVYAAAALETSNVLRRDSGIEAVALRGYERWAEFLAAVDQLHARLEAGKMDGGYRRAIIDAAVDASHLYVPTASSEELAGLARFHYSRIAPTRFWNDQSYQLALEWLLTPIGSEGSPHSVLQADHATNGYRLLDALKGKVAPLWSAARLRPYLDDLPVRAVLFGANAARSAGDEQETRHWLSHAAARDDPAACYLLGVFELELGHADQAAAWWERAAEAGYMEAMFSLGQAANSHGDKNRAHKWWGSAAAAGHVAGMFNLGLLELELGNQDDARAWWLRAANEDDASSMNSLGVLAHEDGDDVEAASWWARAAERGIPEARVGLGNLAAAEGDDDRAVTHWLAAADADVPGGFGAMTIHFLRAGDLAESRRWAIRWADTGSSQALLQLGHVARYLGDLDEARSWWERGADLRDPEAMLALGFLAQDANSLGEAHQWFIRAWEAGSAGAAGVLAALAHEGGDLAEAREWWIRASEQGDSTAAHNLWVVAKQEGDEAAAMRWNTAAANAGDPEAMVSEGISALLAGDVCRARQWWLEAAEHGLQAAMINLGILAAELGDLGAAHMWNALAAEAEEPEGGYQGVAVARVNESADTTAIGKRRIRFRTRNRSKLPPKDGPERET
jgi:TPR repeat protein